MRTISTEWTTSDGMQTDGKCAIDACSMLAVDAGCRCVLSKHAVDARCRCILLMQGVEAHARSLLSMYTVDARRRCVCSMHAVDACARCMRSMRSMPATNPVCVCDVVEGGVKARLVDGIVDEVVRLSSRKEWGKESSMRSRMSRLSSVMWYMMPPVLSLMMTTSMGASRMPLMLLGCQR